METQAEGDAVGCFEEVRQDALLELGGDPVDLAADAEGGDDGAGVVADRGAEADGAAVALLVVDGVAALADRGQLGFEAREIADGVGRVGTPAEALHEVHNVGPRPGGERFSSKGDFARLLQTRTIDVVQPEVLRTGVGGLIKIAEMAEAFDAFVAPHNAQSPFTTVVNTHIGATLPNLLIQECFDDFLEPWSREILSGAVQIVDGYIEVPDAPGFGVELQPDEMAKYPYADRNFLRLFEAGWERRRSAGV